MNRLSWPYESAVSIIELLLSGRAPPSEGSSPPVTLPGFMYDMNAFFELLVERVLREGLPGAHVETQRPLRGLVRYAPGNNPQRRHARTPRPDFTVTIGQETVLLDAKYRDLWAHGVTRDMLYQLTLYAVSRGTGGTAAIIYPTDDPAASEERLDIRGTTGQPWSVSLRPLSLSALERLLDSRDRIALQEHVVGLALGMSDEMVVDGSVLAYGPNSQVSPNVEPTLDPPNRTT